MEYENELLTVKEVAKLARVSPQTVYRWIWENLIKYYESPAGTKRIKVIDAAKALNMSVDEIVQKTKIAKLD